MIQSAFPSFYDQKREFSSSWLLKKILFDFFDAKSVSEMKIFSYAFSFSESIFRIYFKKQKIIGTTTEIRMSPQKDRKDTVFVFELQKFSAHNTKKRRTQHTCAQHASSGHQTHVVRVIFQISRGELIFRSDSMRLKWVF